eukprot:Sro1449_g273630.2  (332) ;mRNA; f:3469-4464
MKMKASLLWALLIGLSNLLPALSQQDELPSTAPCFMLSADPANRNEFVLSSSPPTGTNCMQTPKDGYYRLTITPDLPGRYEMQEEDSGLGYAWSYPALGIHYCVDAGSTLTLVDFVEGAIMLVTMARLPPGETCNPEIIGYDPEYTPVEPPEVPPNGAGWSTPRYYLKADYFGYTVAGEAGVVITMENADNVEIGGDHGGDEYHSIEVQWYLDEQEKRFYGFIESNGTHWNMYEVRVYNSNGEWEYFEGLEGVVAGKRGECFYQSALVLTNDRGSEVRFSNLVLAVFLPWDEQQQPSVMAGRSSAAPEICPDPFITDSANDRTEDDQGGAVV